MCSSCVTEDNGANCEVSEHERSDKHLLAMPGIRLFNYDMFSSRTNTGKLKSGRDQATKSRGKHGVRHVLKTVRTVVEELKAINNNILTHLR
ncbi:hypothetical protein KIN20_010197 [Parelaphostrongylus tenuis]|uniref:Uncharacterized protein n=1 Tax=Parelaphostrongylus tenuis TaxID=148309 RepID=A0AAD5M7I9_PARTN|nr:hypothetical protein KIN20_010197 [Parelaphostrongylus tenuis]